MVFLNGNGLHHTTDAQRGKASVIMTYGTGGRVEVRKSNDQHMGIESVVSQIAKPSALRLVWPA